MKTKYAIITASVIFIFAILWNGLIHLVILKSADSAVEHLRRPDFSDKVWISMLVTLFISVLYTISYMQWRRTGELRETLLHSLFFAILMGVAVDLNQYVLYPLPFMLTAQWFLFGVIEFVIYGLIASTLHKKMA